MLNSARHHDSAAFHLLDAVLQHRAINLFQNVLTHVNAQIRDEDRVQDGATRLLCETCAPYGFLSDTTWDGPLRLHCGRPDGYLTTQRRFLFACGDGGVDDSIARPIRRVGLGATGSDRIIAAVPSTERCRRRTETTVGMRQM